MYNNFSAQLVAAAIRRDHVFWMIVVSLLAIGFYLTYWAYRKRRATWTKFARKHGLVFRMKGSQPMVFGEIDGRDFELSTADRGSDRGLFGIQEVEMRLQLNMDAPVQFDVTNEGVYFTALREAIGDNEVTHVGSDEFDKRTCLHTDHGSEVAKILTKQRRLAILRLIENCRACDVHVTESELKVRERTMVKSIKALDKRLGLMTRTAKAMERLPTLAERFAER